MTHLKKLTEWEQAGLITADQSRSIRTYEAAQPNAAQFLWRHGLLGIGILIIAIGLVAIVASNWSAIPSSVKFITHLGFNLSLAGYLFYSWTQNNHRTARFESGLLILSALSLTFMALIGQIFQTQAPFSDSMLLWWALISPMLLLLGRSKASFLLWTILTITTLCLNSPKQEWIILFITLLLVQLGLLLPLFPFWNNYKPGWSAPARKAGFVTLIALTNMVFFFFHYEFTQYGAFVESWRWHVPVLANIGVTAGLYYLAKRQTSLSLSDIMWIGLTAGHLILLAVLYWLPEWFGWFVIYWLIAGYVGLRLDDRRIVTLAITAIALRIIVLYFSLTHSLMATGLIMIFSGLGVIYIVKTYPRWRAVLVPDSASKNETEQGDAL
jgi:uncharacterized membrane protein